MEKIFYKNMGIYILHRSDELDHETGRPIIMLKYSPAIKSLVWCGTTQLNLKTKEKPLILLINKKTTYFYSSGIERVESQYLKGRWIEYSKNQLSQLNNLQQQQLISKFITFTLEKDPYLELDKLKREINQVMCLVEDLKLENIQLKQQLQKKIKIESIEDIQNLEVGKDYD